METFRAGGNPTARKAAGHVHSQASGCSEIGLYLEAYNQWLDIVSPKSAKMSKRPLLQDYCNSGPERAGRWVEPSARPWKNPNLTVGTRITRANSPPRSRRLQPKPRRTHRPTDRRTACRRSGNQTRSASRSLHLKPQPKGVKSVGGTAYAMLAAIHSHHSGSVSLSS